MKMGDCFWLWGQDAGSHHAASANASWKLPGTNKMGPDDGAKFLGIKNICRVVMLGKPEPPFDAESEKLKDFDKVVWSIVGDSGSTRNDDGGSDLEEVLRQAGNYPNIVGGILDDFFRAPQKPGGHPARYSVEDIVAMRRKLRSCPARPLDLEVVVYKRNIASLDLAEYWPHFDVVTYWNMRTGGELDQLSDDLDRMIGLTPHKRRLAGCYLWNYGQGLPLTIPQISREVHTYHERIKRGELEGIVFCSNCCADLGLEAVDWVRGWIKEVGGENV